MKIRNEYAKFGVKNFYERFGSIYRNPHESKIEALLKFGLNHVPTDKVLDLACGSGEVTSIMEENFPHSKIDGIDPYTADAYKKRTGKIAERFSFEDIGEGVLYGRHYDVVICSYALHLLELSRLPKVVYNLSLISPYLLIISPNKNPIIRPDWGWTKERETKLDLAYSRLYGHEQEKYDRTL